MFIYYVILIFEKNKTYRCVCDVNLHDGFRILFCLLYPKSPSFFTFASL